jgi:hypothetical protein
VLERLERLERASVFDSADHVQIYADQKATQVFVSFDGGSMIAIFPERSLPTFALVVFLSRAPRDELHALPDNTWAGVFD